MLRSAAPGAVDQRMRARVWVGPCVRTAGCQYMGVSYYPDWYAVSWLRCVLCAEFEQAVSEVADVVLLIAYGTEY